jgi:hypothetical protein
VQSRGLAELNFQNTEQGKKRHLLIKIKIVLKGQGYGKKLKVTPKETW